MGICSSVSQSPFRHRIKLDRRHFLTERPVLTEAAITSQANLLAAITTYLREEYRSLKFTLLFHFPSLNKTTDFSSKVTDRMLKGIECIVRFHEVPEKSLKLMIEDKFLTFQVDDNELISEVKQRITNRLRLSVSFRLYMQQLELEDGFFIKDYSIEEATEVQILYHKNYSNLKLRSGLNLEMVCLSEACRSWEQVIYLPLGLGQFDLLAEFENKQNCEDCGEELMCNRDFGLTNCEFLLDFVDSFDATQSSSGRLKNSEYMRKHADNGWVSAHLIAKRTSN
jgi:hypothetical protein